MVQGIEGSPPSSPNIALSTRISAVDGVLFHERNEVRGDGAENPSTKREQPRALSLATFDHRYIERG